MLGGHISAFQERDPAPDPMRPLSEAETVRRLAV